MENKNKIKFKQINIDKYAIHENTKLSFSEHCKVTPIIGLNGSGKSLLLKILEDIKELDFKKEMTQKFTKDDQVGRIKFTLYDYIDFSNEEPKIEEISNLKIGSSIFEKQLKFKTFIKLSFPSIEKVFCFPIPEKTDDTEISGVINKVKEKIEAKENLEYYDELSRMVSKKLKDETIDFIKLDLVKAKEIFFDKFDEGIKGLLSKVGDDNKDDTIELIEGILNKVDTSWKEQLEKEIKGDEEDKFKRGSNTNYSSTLQKEIFKYFNGEKEQDEDSKNALLNIFNNISGRRVQKNSNRKPIKTKPYINIHLNKEKDDFNVVFGFIEKDENNKLEAKFEGDSKNDGFKTIYWYIIKIHLLLDDLENKVILIDELGNYLNPYVIRSFIDLLLRAKHSTIFTSHNPYTINNKTIDSIHSCNRNASSPFSTANDLYSKKQVIDFKSKNILDSATRIIVDSMSIEQELFDWRLKENQLNVYVEGLSDVYAFNIFKSDHMINPISIRGRGEMYWAQKSTLLYFNKDMKSVSLTDGDWKRGQDGTGNLAPGEIDILDRYIVKFDELSNDEFFEIEDIFLKHLPPDIKQEIESLLNENIKLGKISEIKKFDTSAVEQVKTIILLWLAKNNQRNLKDWISSDETGTIAKIKKEFDKIIISLFDHVKNLEGDNT